MTETLVPCRVARFWNAVSAVGVGTISVCVSGNGEADAIQPVSGVEDVVTAKGTPVVAELWKIVAPESPIEPYPLGLEALGIVEGITDPDGNGTLLGIVVGVVVL